MLRSKSKDQIKKEYFNARLFKPVAAKVKLNPTFFNLDKVDLLRYPTKKIHDFYINHDYEFVLPDLHGNALKLIWLLIFYKIVQMEPDDYQTLVHLYQKADHQTEYWCKLYFDKRPLLLKFGKSTPPPPLNADDICQWASILERSVFNKNAGYLTLVGDELSADGANDIFTLLTIRCMHEANIKFTILLSNHNLEFILTIENAYQEYLEMQKLGLADSYINYLNYTPCLLNETIYQGYRSMIGLSAVIENDLFFLNDNKKNGLFHLYNHCYLPHLKALTCHTELEYPMLITHAPFGTKLLRQLERQFFPTDESRMASLHKPFETADELKKVVNEINHQFMLSAQNHQVHELFKCPDDAKIADLPLCKLVWNRQYADLDFDKQPPMYQAHGHDLYLSADRNPKIPITPLVLDDRCGRDFVNTWQLETIPSLLIPAGPKYRLEEKLDEKEEASTRQEIKRRYSI